MELPATFAAFLTWLGTTGAFGTGMSLIVEYVPGWATLDAKLKRFITLLLALGLSFASYALTTWLPGGVKEGAEPIYKLIIDALAIWFASQGTHYGIVKRADRKTAKAPEVGAVG